MSIEPEFETYKQKLDQSMIALRHNDRTNQAAGNLELFAPYVRIRLANLPMAWQEWVTDQEDEYAPDKEIFEYKYDCGAPLGSEREPLLYDDTIPVKRLDDDAIDWDDTNIWSPKKKTIKDWDYEKLNLILCIAYEKAGLTWKVEPNNTEYGLYPDIEPIDLGTATPLDDPKKNDHPAPNPLHQICWINYKGKPKKVTNFRGYAVGIGSNEKPWFFNSVAIRQAKQKPIVMMITATQGEGKTYCGIRLAEILDKRFDSEKQIAMERGIISKLVSGRGGLKRNQAIIVDESQFGASAREWGNKDQQRLMKHIAAARFRGYIIIIVALHRSMLDSIIRERIINYHIHMEERGFATVYEPSHQRFDEKRYPNRMGQLTLQLPDYDTCDYFSCLTCDELDTCQTVRARYERKKSAFVEAEAEKDYKEEMKQAAAEIDDQEFADLLSPYISEIHVNTKGFYEVEGIRRVAASQLGLEVSLRQATRIRGYLMRNHPPP